MGDVPELQAVDRTHVALVGGKGAQLGELSRVDGVKVPDGFCVTTDAYRRFMTQAPSIDGWLARLSRVSPHDRQAIVQRDRGGPATASFAGQQDSYLNIVGETAILDHIRRCRASLFSERAVTYRIHHGFDHRAVQMAVVMQWMGSPQAAGVLFTADPVTGNRRVACVEAAPGLGEQLVSGRVHAEAYTVRDGEVVASARQREPVLADAQVGGLVAGPADRGASRVLAGHRVVPGGG